MLLLLLGFLLLWILPHQFGVVRFAGVSLLWWYGGLVVPLLGWLVAIIAAPSGTSAEQAWARPR